MTLPTPHWLDDLPAGERRDRARQRFYLRIAALFASEDGHAIRLSEMIGLQPRVLGTYSNKRHKTPVSQRIARDIEELTKGVVTAAMLRS